MNREEKLRDISELSGLSMAQIEKLPEVDVERLIQWYDLIQELGEE